VAWEFQPELYSKVEYPIGANGESFNRVPARTKGEDYCARLEAAEVGDGYQALATS
jgi:hypothetical protein